MSGGWELKIRPAKVSGVSRASGRTMKSGA